MINIFRPGQSIIDLTGTIDFHIRLSQGIKWLLRDDFTDTRPAGSVDGTPAVPGPGTRSVVDTNSKISVANGNLKFDSGAASNSGLWLDLVSRSVGRLLVSKITINSIEYQPNIGWHTRASGIVANSLRFQGGSLLAVIDATYAQNVLSVTSGKEYNVCLIQRIAGYYYFLRDSNWLLLCMSSLGSGNCYPVVQTRNSNDEFVVDYMRIPDELWLPTPLAYDTFTRSDGALGSTETSGPDAQVTPSLSWSNRAGTSQISSNSIITTATDGAKAIATVPAGADVLASIALTRGSGTPGIVFRYKDALNYGYAIHNGTNAQLHKVVNGTDTTLVNAAAAYGAGRVFQVVCYGYKWRMFYNNVMIGTEQTVNDGDLQSGTGVGWYTTDTDSKGDNFTVFARGTGGEYDAALNRYIA